MQSKKAFLGTGWAFPPEFIKTQKNTKMLSLEEDINASLQVLLSTLPGERIMLPKFGIDLSHLSFEKLDQTLITYVSDLIETAILYFEPRIDVIKISINEADTIEGKLEIKIDYNVRATNSRSNMVFPFYKEEATDLK